MPASRWNTSWLEILKWSEGEGWSEEDGAALRDFNYLFKPVISPIVQKEDTSEESSTQPVDVQGHIPSVLPVLPLRGLVVYPQTAVPLTIGQPRSNTLDR